MYVTFADSLADVLLPLLPILAASYFTSLLCRLAHWRHRHVRWWFGLLGAGAACISIVCFIQLGSSLQHGEDSYGGSYFLCLACIAESLFAVVPAGIVVWRYRKAYGNVEHAP
jgi:hypothetical protein